MQRWMQSAAGGTSQRLKPAVAMMRSRSRMLVEVPFRRERPVNGRHALSPWIFARSARVLSGRQCRRACDRINRKFFIESIEISNFAIAKNYSNSNHCARLIVRDRIRLLTKQRVTQLLA